jgi:osmotically-inducible protein OsmY
MRKLHATTCAAILFAATAMAQTSASSQSSGPVFEMPPQNSAPAPNRNASPQPVSKSESKPAAKASSTVSDKELEKQVEEQFAHKAEFQNVKITVTGGVVTLEGSVPTKYERQQARGLARSVNGVKRVKERLTLSGGGVSGPGVVAHRTVTAHNNAGSISGDLKAKAGAVKGTSAMSQMPSKSAAPSLNRGTQPASVPPGNMGGTAGAAVGTPAPTSNSTPPPSSSIGAGAATTQQIGQPIARATAPQDQQQGTGFGLTTVDTANLASKINSALKNDPALANNNVMVNIGDQGVEVTGTVDTGKEKVTAMRIAQSYAGNFKVVDRITLAGHAPAANTTQDANRNPSPRTQVNNTPPAAVGNQILPTGTAQNRSVNDPKSSGDKSANPR